MIYAEYIERDRFMPLEIFRYLGDQAAWTAPDDTLVGSFGRTMRIGPMPSYIAFWQCKGMARLDEWEDHFRSPAGKNDTHELATHRAIHLQYGGCYDELITTSDADRSALFAIEYLPIRAEVKDADLTAHFRQRDKAHKTANLAFLLRRIGRLGPDPAGLAVWSFADYVALEAFERSSEDRGPWAAEKIGVYRWFGQEIL